MFQYSTEETFQDGQTIVEEGDSGDWIYVVESGEVEISKKVYGEKAIIDVLKPGGVFGEIAFFTKAPRTATARAIGVTKVGIIDRNFIDHELNKLSGSFQTILNSLALRLRKTTDIAMQVKLRRKIPRAPKVLSLSFKSKEGFFDSFSDNINADGAFIKTSKPLAKGERFFLKLVLPNDPKPLKIDCEVCWSQTKPDDPALRHPGMGIKFINISNADKNRLKEELSEVDSSSNRQ